MDRIHRDLAERSRPRHRPSAEIRDRGAGHRAQRHAHRHDQRRGERPDPSHQCRDGLCTIRPLARIAPLARLVTDVPYGVPTLPALYESWTTNGLIANIGARLVEVAAVTLLLHPTLPQPARG